MQSELCRGNTKAVAENFEQVEDVYSSTCKQNKSCKKDCKEDCTGIPGFKYNIESVERIALFHYITRCVQSTLVLCYAMQCLAVWHLSLIHI